MATIKHKINPYIPKPERKEQPVEEELVQEPIHIPTRVQADIPLLVPNFNKFYDSYATTQGWRYSSDEYANGSVTTIANQTVNVVVNLTVPANTQGPIWNLKKWPGGTLLYPVVRFFSLGPTTATFATQGAISVIFYDQFGNPTPLGVLANNAFFQQSFQTIMPGAITDTGQQINIGTLSFTLNSGATVGTYNWQMAFSAAYLIPALKGYHTERIGFDEWHFGKSPFRSS
jgi:hypothetical protein